MGQVHFLDMKIFRLGASQGCSAPSVNMGPPHMSETIRARQLKFYTHLDGAKCNFWKWKFFARGVSGVQRPLE